MKRRDPDQSAVYHAEKMVFENTLYEEVLSDADFMDLAKCLFVSEWWLRHDIPTPEIKPRRREATNSYARSFHPDWGAPPEMRFCLGQTNPWILAHESAHIATDHLFDSVLNPTIESHGREYRACYLLVAEILLGSDAAKRLEASFDMFVRLRPGQPQAPTISNTVQRDDESEGIFPAFRRRRQIEEIERARQRAKDLHPHSRSRTVAVERINGAIPL